MIRIILLLALSIFFAVPVLAQSTQIISSENIHNLQSVSHIEFDSLPDDIRPASGQFVTNHDATVVVTFGNKEGDPPFSLAIRWTDSERLINRIDDSSLVRYLTDDGKCLYVGYVGYVMVYTFSPKREAANVWLGPLDLPTREDSAVNFWMEDDSTCTTEFYVETSSQEGHLNTLHVVDEALEILYEDIFALPDETIAARVGRIPPPLALTIDFDGNLYRWDMNSNEVTATVSVNDVAMFGKLNNPGTHYVWLPDSRDGLFLADLATESFEQIAALDDNYISHLILTDEADVVIGVDPYDKRGSVSAWITESGERLDLGNYRSCERVQPDLVRLSADGSALVIGCDTGVDIWRVMTDNKSGQK